jgi:hypothetical protein
MIVKNTEKDGKTYMESKEEMKKRLGRSCDFSDSIMMRMIWFVRDEIQHVQESELGVYEVNYDSVLF